MSAFDSAIDDTFGIPQLPNQSDHHDDDALFDNAYIGPRDGQWEVTSSVGSFVDDRCPTVYGYRPKPRGNGYSYGTQMDEGLAKRLMQATIQEKRATAVSAAKDATPRTEVYNETQHSPTPLRATAPKPKPFVVPPLRHRPYQPVTPDTPKTKKPVTKSSEAQSPPEKHQEATTATRSLSPAGKPVQAATIHSEAKTIKHRDSPSAGHSIRILGKNGEEAYVNLPSLPKTFSEAFSVNGRTLAGTPTKRSQQGSIHKAQSQSPQPTAGYGSKTSTKHNADNTSNTLANKKQGPEQQSDRASLPPTTSPIPSRGASPTMMMSGALPPSSSKGSPKPVSAASSCKDCGIAMGGLSAVVSNVNSRKASSLAPGSAISRGVLSVAQEIANLPAASAKQSRSASVASTPSPFEEVGEGVTTGFPRQKKASVHSKQPAKDSESGSRPGSRRSASSNGPSFKSAQQPGKRDASRVRYKPPTVRSASSSSSVTHSFGGFLQDSSAQPTNNQNGWGFDRHESIDSLPSQSHSVKDKHAGSSHGRMKTASTVTPPTRTKFRLEVSSPSDRDEHPCPSHSPVSAFAPSHRAPSPPPSLTVEEPTRFAGGGWISPHPLSVADTDIGAPPQSAVYISAKDVGKSGTLTYNQWKSQRDAAQSISGSFAGSHVPSAVELQTIPAEAYGHPPPTGYVGSFREQTKQSFHQASGRLYDDQQWNQTFGQQSTRSRVTVRPAQSREPSAHSQSSVYTHFPSPSTGQHNAVYDGPTQRSANVVAQSDARTTQHPYDNFGPDHERAPAPGYVVGLTPRELSRYQQSLSNTVSHYSTRLSGLQDEQTPAQPDYAVWNSAQSRASLRAASEHSVHAFPPNLSYPREKIILPMPWDRTSSREGSSTVLSSQARSQRSASDWGDSHRSGTTQVPSGEYLEPRYSAAGSQASGRSGPMANEPLSQVTYGAAEWQDLEDAEDGRGRYESHQGRRMW